jgi:beta-galactosidase
LVELSGVRVLRVSSLPPGYVENVTHTDGSNATITRWREDFELHGAAAAASFSDGRAAIAKHGRVRRVAGWLSDADWLALMRAAAHDAGLDVLDAPREVHEHLRIHRVGSLAIACNFGEKPLRGLQRLGRECLLGQADELAPFGVAVWRV